MRAVHEAHQLPVHDRPARGPADPAARSVDCVLPYRAGSAHEHHQVREGVEGDRVAASRRRPLASAGTRRWCGHRPREAAPPDIARPHVASRARTGAWRSSALLRRAGRRDDGGSLASGGAHGGGAHGGRRLKPRVRLVPRVAALFSPSMLSSTTGRRRNHCMSETAMAFGMLRMSIFLTIGGSLVRVGLSLRTDGISPHWPPLFVGTRWRACPVTRRSTCWALSP